MRDSIRKIAITILVAGTLFLPAVAQTAKEANNTTSTVDKIQSNPVLIPSFPARPGIQTPDNHMQPKSAVDRLKSAWTGMQNSILGKKKPVMVNPVSASDRVFYLRNLKNSTAKHTSPDALVFIKKGFDASKPITLHIHNHGLTTHVIQEFTDAKLQQQLEAHSPNTVFIMPEWALNPAAYSSKAGPFHTPGFFKNMLVEIFSKTEPLKRSSLDDVSDIYVSTFSGGFRATATEVTKNGLEDKVKGITLLDSLYVGDTFDAWLQKHIKEIHDGEVFFHNFFYDTVGHSRALATRIERMLDKQKLSRKCMTKDFAKGLELMQPSTVARHGIVFKYSEVPSPGRNLHQAVNSHYMGIMSKALQIRKSDTRIAGL